MQCHRAAGAGMSPKATVIVAVALMLLVTGANAIAATAHLEVLNLATREVRKFSFGPQSFRIDMRFVPGWAYCEGRPLKLFEFQGRPTVRAELYCFTVGGAAASSSCVDMAGGYPSEVTVTGLLATGAKFKSQDEVGASAGVELSLGCSAD